MNRVICTANDHNMKIYYTDTDSIHIDEDSVLPLAKIYEEKYGRQLIGKNLGQFHCDFDFKGMDDVRSVGLLVLGKKCYIDKLEGTDKNGDCDGVFNGERYFKKILSGKKIKNAWKRCRLLWIDMIWPKIEKRGFRKVTRI